LESHYIGEAKKNAGLGVIIGISPETILMGRLMGLEPTNAGATIRCVNPFATIAMFIVLH
jgi:hypothetical protein